MPFVFRVLIILIAFLFSNRVIPGIYIENFFFEFCIGVIYAILNAWVRNFAHLFKLHHSWVFLGIIGLVLNVILYILFMVGVWKFVGMTATVSGALWAGAIVWIISLICNHYIIPKIPKSTTNKKDPS